jgi:hypothetical protein
MKGQKEGWVMVCDWCGLEVDDSACHVLVEGERE